MTMNDHDDLDALLPLADVARADLEIAKVRVLENLDRLARQAVGRSRSFVRRDGTKCEMSDADLRSAIQAMQAGASVLGLAPRRVAAAAPAETGTDQASPDLDAELVGYLRSRGFRVEPEPESEA